MRKLLKLTCDLCFNPSEKSDGRVVLVELDRIVLSSTTLSNSWKTFFLSSKFSGTHSCTNIAPFTAVAKSVVPEVGI